MAECEKFATNLLRSPSTYKRVKIETEDKAKVNPAEFFELTKQRPSTVPPAQPGYRWVKITYDAANAYGTPVREKYECAFELNSGQLVNIDDIRRLADDPASRLKSKEAGQGISDFVARGRRASGDSTPSPPGPTYDCCIGGNTEFMMAFSPKDGG